MEQIFRGFRTQWQRRGIRRWLSTASGATEWANLVKKRDNGKKDLVWKVEVDVEQGVLRKAWGFSDGEAVSGLRSKETPLAESSLGQLAKQVQKKLEEGYIGDVTPGLGASEALVKPSNFASESNKTEDLLLLSSTVKAGSTLPALCEPLSIHLHLLNPTSKQPERLWSIEYDPQTNRATRSFGKFNGKLQSKETPPMNPNEAAVMIAKSVQDKLSKGFQLAPESTHPPEWIIEYRKQVNERLDRISIADDEESLDLTLFKKNRFWRVQVIGEKAVRSWGVVGGKPTERTRVYSQGKGKRTCNQQARFEALTEAHRKMDREGYTTVSHTELDDAEIAETINEETGSQEKGNKSSKRTEAPDLWGLEAPLPMLAYACDLEKLGKKHEIVYAQPKLDGLRCIADLKTGQLWSRSRKKIETLDHVTQDIKLPHWNEGHDLRWIDGELYSHGMSIQTINSIIRSGKSSPEEREQIKLHVFDAILDLPFSERWARVQKWHASSFSTERTSVVLTETAKLHIDDLMSYHAKLTNEGYEGVMVRLNVDTTYQIAKRSTCLQKIKTFMQEEYPCVDILPQKHSEEEVAGSFMLKLSDGRTFQATPKCTFEEKVELWKNRDIYCSGDYLGIVQFFNVSDDNVPRFPVLLGFRHKDDL